MSQEEPEEPLLSAGLEGVPAEAFRPPEASPDFRRRVLAQTTARLRARARRRRAGMAAMVLCAYAAGVCTIGVVADFEPLRKHQAKTRLPQPLAPAVAEPAQSQPALAPPPRQAYDAEAFAVQLAAAPPAERGRLLRSAGDRYLEQGDLRYATQCYRRLLNLVEPDAGYAVEARDSWLLATLKLARRKETSHDQRKT